MTDETTDDDGDNNRTNEHTQPGRRAHYLDFDQVAALLAGMNIQLSRRQVKRSSEMNARGKRKLPWFIDPIDGRLKIERKALLAAYFNRQVEAERNCAIIPRGTAPERDR
jgi:hypothetical protein